MGHLIHLVQHHDLLKELGIVLGRTVILYVIALIVMRLAGKRALGKMDPFDFVVTISIGSAIAIGMEADNKFFPSVAPVVMLGALQWLLTRLSLASPGIERLSRGSSAELVRDGNVDRKALKKERVTRGDLTVGLRHAGIEKVEDVKRAVLEPTGKLSVIPADTASPLTTKDIEAIAQAVAKKLKRERRLGRGSTGSAKNKGSSDRG